MLIQGLAREPEYPAVESVSTSKSVVTSIVGSSCNSSVTKPNQSRDLGSSTTCNCFRTFLFPCFSEVCAVFPMNIQMWLAESTWLVIPGLLCLAPTSLHLFWVDAEGSQGSAAGTFVMSRSCFLQKELFSNYLRLASYPFCCLASEEGCMPIRNAAIWFALPWKCQPERLWGCSCLLSKHSSRLWW